MTEFYGTFDKLHYLGKVLVEASRWFTSTKTCSLCQRKQEMALAERVFLCSCGFKIGRDINAAINLKNVAIEKYKAAGASV